MAVTWRSHGAPARGRPSRVTSACTLRSSGGRSVGISIVYLGARYAQEHYLACALILISALVSVVVQLQARASPSTREPQRPGAGLVPSPTRQAQQTALPPTLPPTLPRLLLRLLPRGQTGDPPLGEYTNALKQTVTSSPLWYLIYVVGTVPAAISNCYKQKCLKGVDLEVMYATLWAGNWQILWGVVLFPMNWLPLPTPAPQNYPAETGTYLSNTLTCFFGSAPTHWNGTAHVVSSGDAVCASPGGSAALWFVFYLLFNVSFNVLLLVPPPNAPSPPPPPLAAPRATPATRPRPLSPLGPAGPFLSPRAAAVAHEAHERNVGDDSDRALPRPHQPLLDVPRPHG